MPKGNGPMEFIDEVRAFLGLRPLPPELEPSRRRCACGRKHRCRGDQCARCAGFHAAWKPQKHELQP